MNRDTIERFKSALSRRRDLLLDEIGSDETGSNAACDPEMVHCLEDAIDKIEHGEFGVCSVCRGEIEPSRLALDYTVSVCLECLSETDRRMLERELQMAAEVQRNLLPRNVPAIPNTDIAVVSQPAGIVGGDYFDFFPAPDGGQSIAIGDVMGKGLPASMLMANLQASLRILGPEQHDLTDLAVRLNTLFRHNLGLIKFISLILARVDRGQDYASYLNAGHNPALFWKSSERTGYWLEPTGPAIGLMKDPTFTSERVRLESGDMLLLYTDGLVEARNGSGEEFGKRGILEFTASNDHLSTERFIAALRDVVNTHSGAKRADDMTLMAISRI